MVDNREGKANVRFTLQKGLEGCEREAPHGPIVDMVDDVVPNRSPEVPAVEAFHFFRQNSRYCCSMNSRSLNGLVASESRS